jgi:hypothetical protein
VKATIAAAKIPEVKEGMIATSNSAVHVKATIAAAKIPEVQKWMIATGNDAVTVQKALARNGSHACLQQAQATLEEAAKKYEPTIVLQRMPLNEKYGYMVGYNHFHESAHAANTIARDIAAVVNLYSTRATFNQTQMDECLAHTTSGAKRNKTPAYRAWDQGWRAAKYEIAMSIDTAEKTLSVHPGYLTAAQLKAFERALKKDLKKQKAGLGGSADGRAAKRHKPSHGH